MEKYLGNKRVMLGAIHEIVEAHCPGARTFCDLLAGTTNVARYFRRHGLAVTSNDINRFSFILGATYLSRSAPPPFRGLRLGAVPPSARSLLREHFDTSVRRDGDTLFDASAQASTWDRSRRAAQVLAWLNTHADAPGPSSGRIARHFSSSGASSAFRSLRGTTGRRNYFSAENARKLDRILDCIRAWTREGRLTLPETCFLLCSVIEEVVIVANVNGTFHDFNRDELWPNSRQPLTLRLPLAHYDAPPGHVYCDDALALGPLLPRHDVVYIDPPYNFRQYSAYYHFLNLLAAWPFLDDVDDYLKSLEFVRGQNMRDDFTSPLCFRDDFIGTLRRLISSVNARWIVLSYYGGRNHWNHWSRCEAPRDEGARLLTEVFSDPSLFSSHLTVPVLGTRLNYQSRVGARKHLVDEHLYVGECVTRRRSKPPPLSRISALNANFKLDQFCPAALSGSRNQMGADLLRRQKLDRLRELDRAGLVRPSRERVASSP